MNRKKSLRERILVAATKEEIQALLAEGDGYENATTATRTRWIRASRIASARIDSSPKQENEVGLIIAEQDRQDDESFGDIAPHNL